MFAELEAIRWPVPVAGFRVADVPSLQVVRWQGQPGWAEPSDFQRPGWALVENPAPPGKPAKRAYRPTVEETALYRNFADLPVNDPEAIAIFASRYGSLDGTSLLKCKDPLGTPGDLYLNAEHGRDWQW